MKESNKLFELISSMSKSEKAYYKRYLSIHSKGNEGNYIRLFDTFANEKEYDAVKIKHLLRNSPVLKHFSSYQVYLYNSLLKCLRIYHSNKSTTTTVMESLLDSVFLNDKGLYLQSSKMLNRAEIVAKKEEDIVSLLKVYDLQQKNNYYAPDLRQLQKQEKEMYTSLSELMDKIKEKNDINRLFDKTLILYLKYGENTSEKTTIDTLHKILHDPLLKKGRKYYTKESLYRVFDLKSFLFYTLGDYSAFRDNIKLHISTLENDALFSSVFIKDRYAGALSNLIYVNGKLGNLKEVEISFNKVRAIQPDSIKQEIRLFHCSHGNITDAYINNGAPEMCLGLVPEIINFLKKHKQKISLEQSLLFKGNIVVIYFSNDDYRNSLKWIHEINNSRENKIREDILVEIKLLEILIHYEYKNFQLLESLMNSLRRVLVKTKRLDAFFKTMLTHLKKLSYVIDKNEVRNIFISLKNELSISIKAGKNERPYIVAWIKKHSTE